MFYPLTLPLIISVALPAKIPLTDMAPATPTEGDDGDTSQDHFHQAISSLDTFLHTISNVTSDHTASTDPTEASDDNSEEEAEGNLFQEMEELTSLSEALENLAPKNVKVSLE